MCLIIQTFRFLCVASASREHHKPSTAKPSDSPSPVVETNPPCDMPQCPRNAYMMLYSDSISLACSYNISSRYSNMGSLRASLSDMLLECLPCGSVKPISSSAGADPKHQMGLGKNGLGMDRLRETRSPHLGSEVSYPGFLSAHSPP
jgi:hypothetical protein